MDTEGTCQVNRLGGWVGGRLSCISPQGHRPYLVIVLLGVLVKLVQCHKCVQGVCVCLGSDRITQYEMGGYGSPKTSPTEQQAVMCWLCGNITDTPVKGPCPGKAACKAHARQ